MLHNTAPYLTKNTTVAAICRESKVKHHEQTSVTIDCPLNGSQHCTIHLEIWATLRPGPIKGEANVQVLLKQDDDLWHLTEEGVEHLAS